MPAENLGPDASTVTITLEPAEGGTLVRLVHDGLTEEQAASHLEGWNHFFGRLEVAATTGDAGPDEWASAPADLNQLTSADATLAVCQNVLRGIGDDLDRPTPCSEFTIGELADHLIGSMVNLGGMAGGVVVPAEAGTVESRVAFVAQQSLEAWHKRGLEGTVKLGESDVPATVAASILSLELLVHAWDFAVATGQQVTVSDELSQYVLGLAHEVISPQARQGGAFADVIEVGPDAGILNRLVAFTGRAAALEVTSNTRKGARNGKVHLAVQGPCNTPGRHHPRSGRAAHAGVGSLDGQGQCIPGRRRGALHRHEHRGGGRRVHQERK